MSEPTHSVLNVNNDLKLRSLLAAIDRSPSQTPVFRLWQTILAQFFPISEGFATYYKVPEVSKDQIPGCEIFGVRRALCGQDDPNEFVQKEIVVMLCKQAALDIPENWAKSKDELSPYMLEMPHSATELGPPGEVVGVAIGRRVQFSRWDAKKKDLEKLHDEPLDMFMPDQAEKVAEFLNDSKDKTWDYMNWEPIEKTNQ